MSEALYARVLTWHGPRGGIAKTGAVLLRLESAPDICGLRIDGLEYFPEVRVGIIRPYAEAYRDMTAAEILAANSILDRMAAAE